MKIAIDANGVIRFDGVIVAYLTLECKGPNINCRRHARNGHTVHIAPTHAITEKALVLPSYHFETIKIAIESLIDARNNAITINTDAELIAARTAQIAHYLPIGWIDPSRR